MLAVDDEAAWESLRSQWQLRPGTIYLNHGSFGPPPRAVREQQRKWKDRMDSQPMDFFFREQPGAWRGARNSLARFLRAADQDLVFTENATQAMNLVAATVPLKAGDEVLLTDHEYGAVVRIWERQCARTGAELRTVSLPVPIESKDQVVEAILSAFTPRTRVLVISHITSPTAIILPVREVCIVAKQRGVVTCIDGPHAPAQIPLDLSALDCDFYTASCHKWLSAPFGSGFLFVAPWWQSSITPLQLSWGRLRPDVPERWDEEFIWSGTRDGTAYFTLPAAIQFLQEVGGDLFRQRTHYLAARARQLLFEFADRPPLVPDSAEWYGSMAHMPLPEVDAHQLQQDLWQRFGIEVPIVNWGGRQWIRVSCHLYNGEQDLLTLQRALQSLLR